MSTSAQPPPSPEYLAEDDTTKVIVVMWVVTGVPLLFIILRVWARCILAPGRFGWDDAIAIAAQACLMGYAGVTTAAAVQGLGRHIEAVAIENPVNLIHVGLLAQVCQVLAVMSCTLGKTAFAVTLLRILTQRWLKWTIWFIIITMNLVNVLTCFFVFLQCKNPKHLWNPAIPSECWDPSVFTNFSLFVGSYSGLQDFVLALIPWFVIMKLQMRKKEKVAIAAAMSLGVFAGATSIVKVVHLVNLSKRSDFTWHLAPLFLWAAAEDGLTIVAGTIPTLRPILKVAFPQTSQADSYQQSAPSYAMKKPRSPGPGMFQPKSASQVTTHVYHGDDTSDRSILDKTETEWGSPPEGTTIRKTSEIVVSDYDYNRPKYQSNLAGSRR